MHEGRQSQTEGEVSTGVLYSNKEESLLIVSSTQMEGVSILSCMTPLIDSDEALCIVTAFCEEGDLFKRIRDKDVHKETFSEDEIMDMFIQVTHPHPHPQHAVGMAICMPRYCREGSLALLLL